MKSNQINTNKMKIKHLFLSALAVAMVAVGCKKEEGGNNGAPSITLDPETIEFAVGETGSKTVTVQSNREWKIETVKEAWLTVEKVSETEAKVTVSEKNTGKDRTATVSFRVTGKAAKLTVTQKGEGGAVTPVEEGDGTKENPYSASQASAEAGKLDADAFSESVVYVKGIVAEIKSDYESTISRYGSISLWISDDGSTANKFYVYALKDVGGNRFSDASKITTGAEIVVCGYLQNYKGNTPEMTMQNVDGSYVNPQLVSVNGGGSEPPVVEEVTATGVVVAVSAQGFLIQTETGDLKYVFDAEIEPSVKIGDNVTVIGNKDSHNDIEQIANYTVKTNSEGNQVSYPEATEITAANIADYKTALGYVKTSGILSVSGNYYNLNINGASLTGSLSYPLNIDASFKDKKVDVVGYFVGISASKYFNILVTSVALSADQPVVEEPGEGSIVLTFPDDNSTNNKVGAYSKSWVAKKGDLEFDIVNFNNNNWSNNWTYIKCGSKNGASVASIATKAAISTKIDKVVIFASAYAKANVTSAKLFVNSTADFTGVEGTDLTYDDGKLSAEIQSPAENLFYKVVFDCQKGGANGFVQVEKFVLWVK